ncbi:hypothetical protein BV22DRAFT_667027 [Leucogyrophana mollusca]|uniref:Uncharacterized protein n=1 Tax=Leucogyrophana mollusca TaxID=85980 RepID=A0ACB8BAR0_9AGAM|nr:hypothetical protein BV22DRAFT_667027 [Leucogyrophana mollusca]
MQTISQTTPFLDHAYHYQPDVCSFSHPTACAPRIKLLNTIMILRKHVCGAAQGIGRATALRLADDGLDVAISDLPSQRSKLDAVAEEIRAKGRPPLS